MKLRNQIKLEEWRGKEIMFRYLPQTLISWEYLEEIGEWLIVTDKRHYRIPKNEIDDELDEMEACFGSRRKFRFHKESTILDDDRVDLQLDRVCRIIRRRAQVSDGAYSKAVVDRIVKQIESF